MRVAVLHCLVKLVFLLATTRQCVLGVSRSKSEAERSKFIEKETSWLEKKTSCNLQNVSKRTVHGLWLQNQISAGSILCILKLLQDSSEDSFAWSLAGTSFDQREAKSKADFCFKQAVKLSGKHSEFVKEWSYLAPFVIGKTEFDGDPVFAYGGIANASRFRSNFKPSPRFFSELVTNAVVKWEVTRQAQAGHMVQIRPPVDWNDLVSSLGSLGITEWQGWAVGDLVVNEDSLPLKVQCLGVARCIVGQATVVGDLYHRDYFWSPVALPRGAHPVFIPLRAKVAASFKFSVTSTPPHFKLFQPSFLPDIYDSYYPDKVYISVPVGNYLSGKWLKVNKVELHSQSHGRLLQSKLVDTVNSVAPGQTRPVIVQLGAADTNQGSKLTDTCSDITLSLKFRTSEGTDIVKLSLRCRTKGSSFLFTFLDHDGSVQHAAAIEPLGRCREAQDGCPVVLSLHGTTVPPQNQADSYKKMVDRDFQFGVRGMWLLAPTRHGAHNWEGPGTLTAIRSLQALQELSQDKTMFRFEADPTQIVFAGHSMGGHGAWHLATHFPDRAVGLVSLAGWITKEEYGDSNLFFRHDLSNSFVDPSLKAVLEACVAENDVDKHASNLKGVSVLARIGGSDRTVHPFFVRRMVRVLTAVGVDVTYTELPGLEHWWWDTKETNDGGCVNDGQIRKFFDQALNSIKHESPATKPESAESCTKENAGDCGNSDSRSLYSKEDEGSEETVTLVVVNPALGEGLKGVVVLQQTVPFRKSTVKLKKHGKKAWLVTQNVRCLEVTVKPNIIRSWNLYSVEELVIDGSPMELSELSLPYIFCKKIFDGEKAWEHRPNLYTEALPVPLRGPHNYGPARRVAERPFLIVVGTKGDSSSTSILLQHASFIANQFFSTSDTLVPIVEDRNLDEGGLEHKNLIIIGSPTENSVAGQFLTILPDLAIEYLSVPHLRLGTCVFEYAHTGILALAPHGSQGLALLLMGLSAEGLSDVVKMATPTIPPMARSPFSNLVPDFVITGPDVGLKGPGGFLCAGFWDNTWAFSDSSASCACAA